MNYTEALEYIHGTKKFGSKLGLDNIRELLRLLGNPQNKLKYIHVAGTNGKGSTSSYIASILDSGGYKVGLFTSPYLERFNERIKINDVDIPDERLAEVTLKVKKSVDEMLKSGFNHPTEFEIVTAIAFQYYMEEETDLVVLEVGLGGRHDSTNVIDSSLASVITTISMDHTDILGDTIGKIAWEKAGIIKKNGLVISYPQESDASETIEKVSNEQNAELIIAHMDNITIKESSDTGSRFSFKYGTHTIDDIRITLLGEYQVNNAALALTTILELRDKGLLSIENSEIIEGLVKAKWVGRLEILKRNPTFLIDGAHNIQGVQSLAKNIKTIFKYNKLILGIGILSDKDVDSMVSQLAPLADKIIVTEPNIFRALKAEELAKKIEKFNTNYIVESNIEKAIDKAIDIADNEDLIVFAGSLYLIGDVRSIATKK